MDTIVALSSGRPPAAIGVVRMSGPDALRVGAALAGPLPPARRAGLRSLRAGDGAVVDRALVLVFPGPDSATGEDLVELHCHGGRAVVAAVIAAAVAAGVRAALPGEFTRRALGHGRIDLAEAEGLADLLAAETEAQRRAAQRVADGMLSRRVRGWLDRLSAAAAAIEVAIDYADEEDAAVSLPRDALAALSAEWRVALSVPAADRLRDGVRVVVAGPPNAGKSSLVNALAGRGVAIVSPIAGTTRDRIEASVAEEGIPFVLCDTAGLTRTDDPIEAQGVALAEQAIAVADIVLWLGDDAPPSDAIAVHARCDALGRAWTPDGRLAISAVTGEGLALLWRRLVDAARVLLPGEDDAAFTARQRALVGEALAALDAGVAAADPLVVAEQVRLARGALAAILGVNATEAMLDALFGRFCLGK